MKQCNCAVQTLGPDVTSTLYRKGSQDYVHVDVGNAADLPSNLNDQSIVVDNPNQ